MKMALDLLLRRLVSGMNRARGRRMGSGHQDLQAWFIRGLLRRLLRRHTRGLLRGLIRELLRGHNFRGGVELVVDDDLHQVVHGVLDLDVLALEDATLLADVFRMATKSMTVKLSSAGRSTSRVRDPILRFFSTRRWMMS